MPAKTKTVYVCAGCGAESAKWIGRCPQCGEWNTYQEEHIVVDKKGVPPLAPAGLITEVKPVPLSAVEGRDVVRLSTANVELDRVLGGGIVPGALILIGGEPGIGKSTLVLQMAMQLPKRVLYVSGEESIQQIKLRADRISRASSENCMVVSDTRIDVLQQHIDNTRPEIVVVDSIQTMQTERTDSLPGSISQIKECTAVLMRLAKTLNIPIILIGHINKDGQLAGPKVLEHMVDVVLQFEGDRNHLYRILRSIKNRFGSTNEIGIFEMMGDGLREVANPSEMLLGNYAADLSGVAIAAAMEGARPFLIETQALVSTAAYGTPQRSAMGFDVRRMNMLLAVLEKRAGFKIAAKDVFLNLAGGIKVTDTALDLPVAAAVLSSSTDMPIQRGVCMAGEIGLSGELRPVARTDQRVREAAKLGFSRIIIPEATRLPPPPDSIELCRVSRLADAFRLLFQ
ncbi:MAG: DNA repair protein RadA [Bacteroidales bacterium]|nr:DNA repair protein RadA [Bacteroidales bacterium]MDD7725305.1 DNA repair protein RadA [Bacteroidales bacterium]MDY4174637.1 DNA repair protein RadA [Bacteroidales bacterium]